MGLLGQWGPSRVTTLRTSGNQIRHATLVADPVPKMCVHRALSYLPDSLSPF